MMVNRALKKLQPEFPEMTVAEVDIVSHPVKAWENGIRMIPALVAGEKTLSGVYLGSSRIREFLEDCRKAAA
ncbi:hypothetical protein MNBD_DELTA04-1200 [hydrothermal vent metagenome]|uniref:Thioredoxin-like fold domain-containing protein n=1 Tax=hydrothermal vent metagenome TaxID=652676 RepID=A0A3B0W2N8_9ZZZZ